MLERVGENLKLARLRRRLRATQVAERANISRTTLYSMEHGDPAASVGNLLRVLAVLGLEKDLEKIGADDSLGRKLQDLELQVNKRAPRRSDQSEP